MMVLAMLLVVPLLSFEEEDLTEQTAIRSLHLAANDATVSAAAFAAAVAWVTEYYSATRPLLELDIRGTTHTYYFKSPNILSFR